MKLASKKPLIPRKDAIWFIGRHAWHILVCTFCLSVFVHSFLGTAETPDDIFRLFIGEAKNTGFVLIVAAIITIGDRLVASLKGNSKEPTKN